MNKFANYRNGQVTINTYRAPDALLTDLEGILIAHQETDDGIYTASIDGSKLSDYVLACFDDYTDCQDHTGREFDHIERYYDK